MWLEQSIILKYSKIVFSPVNEFIGALKNFCARRIFEWISFWNFIIMERDEYYVEFVRTFTVFEDERGLVQNGSANRREERVGLFRWNWNEKEFEPPSKYDDTLGKFRSVERWWVIFWSTPSYQFSILLSRVEKEIYAILCSLQNWVYKRSANYPSRVKNNFFRIYKISSTSSEQPTVT